MGSQARAYAGCHAPAHEDDRGGFYRCPRTGTRERGSDGGMFLLNQHHHTVLLKLMISEYRKCDAFF